MLRVALPPDADSAEAVLLAHGEEMPAGPPQPPQPPAGCLPLQSPSCHDFAKTFRQAAAGYWQDALAAAWSRLVMKARSG